MCWERIPNIHDSIKEKVFCFVQSKTLTNDLVVIVTGGACEIGSYIVVYSKVVKVVTLLVIFVSSANYDILQVRPSSISLTSTKKRMALSTESCGTPPVR